MNTSFYTGFEKQARVFAPAQKMIKGLKRTPRKTKTLDYSKINQPDAQRIEKLRAGGGTLDYRKF